MMGTAAGMMIEENLAIASRRGQTPGLGWSCSSSQHEYFRELLKELDLGLENRMTAKVGLLSGGQRQALTLLMATLKKPKLLLLDEHTAALDPKTAEKVLNLTEKIVTRDNLTTLMITHNMRDALRFGNRLIMLHNGQIIIDVQGEEKKAPADPRPSGYVRAGQRQRNGQRPPAAGINNKAFLCTAEEGFLTI